MTIKVVKLLEKKSWKSRNSVNRWDMVVLVIDSFYDYVFVELSVFNDN